MQGEFYFSFNWEHSRNHHDKANLNLLDYFKVVKFEVKFPLFERAESGPFTNQHLQKKRKFQWENKLKNQGKSTLRSYVPTVSMSGPEYLRGMYVFTDILLE